MRLYFALGISTSQAPGSLITRSRRSRYTEAGSSGGGCGVGLAKGADTSNEARSMTAKLADLGAAALPAGGVILPRSLRDLPQQRVRLARNATSTAHAAPTWPRLRNNWRKPVRQLEGNGGGEKAVLNDRRRSRVATFRNNMVRSLVWRCCASWERVPK